MPTLATEGQKKEDRGHKSKVCSDKMGIIWAGRSSGPSILCPLPRMVFLSRIYTKSGDAGETGLGDGTRVRKDHPRVVAYGEVDELNALIGDVLQTPGVPESELLRGIQNDLFDVGADLCVPSKENEQAGKALRVTPGQVGN